MMLSKLVNILIEMHCKLKYIIALLTLFICSLPIFAQGVKLTNGAKMSLLTCSSGQELYSAFGHSAIRVVDDSLHIDIVFNYGTFDFHTPNFYLKFMNGDLDYMLASSSFRHFEANYIEENRTVYEGLLDLDKNEKQELWDYLVWNIQPENSYYRYDFFFDNCATRIRDIVFKAKGIEKDCQETNGMTFRDYIHQNVSEDTWTAQGIDLLLGCKTDRLATTYERAYLPVYLDSLFLEAGVICKQRVLINEVNNEEAIEESSLPKPFKMLTGFMWAILMLCVLEREYKVYIVWIDIVLFVFTLLLSILFWYLWLFTKHDVCSLNLNVLWASLLYLPMIFMMGEKHRTSKPMKWMAVANCIALGVFLLLSLFGVQDTPSMTIPFALALLLRNGNLYLMKK